MAKKIPTQLPDGTTAPDIVQDQTPAPRKRGRPVGSKNGTSKPNGEKKASKTRSLKIEVADKQILFFLLEEAIGNLQKMMEDPEVKGINQFTARIAHKQHMDLLDRLGKIDV